MVRVDFDTRELYYLTQYLPLHRALRRRGVETRFVVYPNRPSLGPEIRATIEALGLPVLWHEEPEHERSVELYRRERPDWIVFGNQYPWVADLPAGTRTAMLYHGIGMKNDVWSGAIMNTDVRFLEGPYYERGVRGRFPDRPVLPVGYAKLDPLFGPEEERPRADLQALGLDPSRPTVLYAPSMAPSSFPNMADRWPEHCARFNLIVKPHYLSFFSSSRRSHRRKMALWSRAENVHVCSLGEWDPLPFMVAADLMVSDVSAMVYEFAALDKPIVCCDFLHHHLFRRGPFRYRLRRRMDEGTMQSFSDVAAHAPRYRDLPGIVEEELARPERRGAARRRATGELIGPTDGRVCERIADHLLGPGLKTAPRRLEGASTP